MNFFGDLVFSQKINQRSNIPWEKIIFGCLMIALFTLTYSVAAEAQVTFVGNGQQLNNFVGRGVALADFNGDGALDAFVVNESGQNSQYKVYFGDGKGQFADNGQRLERPIGAAKPVVYDIDGDGSKDVITGRTVWLNDGHGHFSPDAARFTDTDDANFWQCRLADLNGDSLMDAFAIAMMNMESKGRVYLNDNLAHPKSHLCPLPPHGESVSLGEKINSYNLLQIEDSHPRIGGVVQEDDAAVMGESQVDDAFL